MVMDSLTKVLKTGAGDPKITPSPAQIVASSATPTPGAIQPVAVNLQANVPAQLPIMDPTGVTVFNALLDPITLGTEPTFVINPITLNQGATLPWKTATTLWTLSGVSGTIMVLPGLYNFYSPLVNTPPANVVYQQTITGAILNVQVALPPSTKTLVFTFSPALSSTLEVVGNNSGIQFYNQIPYLGNNVSGPGTTAIIPVDGDIDPTISFSIPNPYTGKVTIYADNEAYNESLFYTGYPLQFSTTTVGVTTLITPPCRLLSAYMDSESVASASAALRVNGVTILRAYNVGAATVNGPNTYFEFPPNYIVPTGGTVQASIVVGGIVSVSYAYP